MTDEIQEDVLLKMSELGIQNLEIVFSKVNEWKKITFKDIEEFIRVLQEKNIKISSSQSLFFNVDCNDFTEDSFITHMEKVITISHFCNLQTLVLGSPNLRKIVTNHKEKMSQTFKKIDDMLSKTNITLCMEPNTKEYGGEFFFDVKEIVNWISKNEFINIKTMIDTHNSLLENKNPIEEFEMFEDYVHHIHISEPKLEILHRIEFHQNFSDFLKSKNFQKTITYEVKPHEKILESIEMFHKLYS